MYTPGSTCGDVATHTANGKPVCEIHARRAKAEGRDVLPVVRTSNRNCLKCGKPMHEWSSGSICPACEQPASNPPDVRSQELAYVISECKRIRYLSWSEGREALDDLRAWATNRATDETPVHPGVREAKLFQTLSAQPETPASHTRRPCPVCSQDPPDPPDMFSTADKS